MHVIKFSFEDGKEEFVAWLDREMIMIQTTEHKSNAKTWKTMAAAERFRQEWSGCGAGMVLDNTRVVSWS